VTRNELLAELFGDWHHDPAAVVAFDEWLVSSRRFTGFVTEHLTKVRKKLRTSGDQEGALDVLYELEVAHRVVSVKAHGLAYEPFAGAKERGPDFAVTFNGTPWFLLEVTRLGAQTPATAQRIARAVTLKLKQLRAEGPNVVLVGVGGGGPDEQELALALVSIARDAETADDSFFSRLGMRDRKAFFQYYERLAAVMVRTGSVPGAAVTSWFNPRARRQVETRGLQALLGALAE